MKERITGALRHLLGRPCREHVITKIGGIGKSLADIEAKHQVKAAMHELEVAIAAEKRDYAIRYKGGASRQ